MFAADKQAILEKLASMYPHMEPALVYHNPFELLVSTILAAQCTDARVNLVTPALFAAYPTLEAMAESLGIYQGYVCPVMDARRSQVYNALFYVNQKELSRTAPDRAISLADLGEAV